jgi:acetyltransferase-like isoleucine patch superfamily enzyme
VGCTIGRNTYIGPHCVIGAGGGIRIGEDVVIGAYVNLLAENHNFDQTDKLISQQGVNRSGIIIERNAWVGNMAIILDGVTIGEGSVVGAGALVTKDVPPFSVAVGNPARVIKTLRNYAEDTIR